MTSMVRSTRLVTIHARSGAYAAVLGGLSGSQKLKVLGKSVGLCKTAKRKDQLYIRLLVSVLRIICENFNPNGLLLARL